MLRLAALAVHLLSLFLLVPVTSMCGVVVVSVGGVCVSGVCVYTYIYVYIGCVNIYTYIISPNRSQSNHAARKAALHRCPAWSSPPEPTLKQGALSVLLIGFLSFSVFV